MEEIKVGEYVRTKNGDIYKIQNLNDYDFLRDKFYCLINKHSKNIIDLIEAGDYVNGRLVLQVDYKNKNVCLLIPLTDTKANTNIMWYGYEDIRTVVTKERFESECYKVESNELNIFELNKEEIEKELDKIFENTTPEELLQELIECGLKVKEGQDV